MLWYKSWLETRWRFLIGLGVIAMLACAVVLAYPRMQELLRMVPAVDKTTSLGRLINEGASLASTFNGYVWSQWFLKGLPQAWTLFAALLGAGGLLSQTHRGEGLFTLSLPVSRMRLMGVRAGTCLAELLVLALVPSLLIPVLAPAIGESYGVGSVLVHGLCLFTAGTIFFSLSFLLSTVFHDVWRPFLIVFFLSIVEQTVRDFTDVGVFRLMSAEAYFRGGGLPWLGLLAAAAASAAMLYGAAVRIARRDF